MAMPNLDLLPISDLISLRGRVAIVTGARSVGFGIARCLPEAGAEVLLTGLRRALQDRGVPDRAARAAATRMIEADKGGVINIQSTTAQNERSLT